MIFLGENYHLVEKQTDLSYMTITITLSNRSSVSNFILSPITNKNFERNRALKKRKKGKLSIQGTLLPFGYCTVPGTSESSLKVQTDKKAAQILVVLHRNRPPGSFNFSYFFYS